MFTSIYALDWVVGGGIWLLGCVICLAIALIITFSIKANRIKKNPIVAIIGVAISGIICDVVWYLIYFPNGEYLNMGLASASGLLLYPICLAVGVTAVSIINIACIKRKLGNRQ